MTWVQVAKASACRSWCRSPCRLGRAASGAKSALLLRRWRELDMRRRGLDRHTLLLRLIDVLLHWLVRGR